MDSNLSQLVLLRKGCPIHYWMAFQEGNPLVVLTHGAGVKHRSFNELIPAISLDYRVLSRDVRGHGLSQLENLFHDFQKGIQCYLERG